MENEAALEIQQIKICVENLPPDSTEREVAQLFEKYGKVYVVVVKNSARAPCRYSLVEMQLSAGLEAIQALDSYIYDNHKLRVHRVARILLMDDDAEMGQLIGMFLESVGYQYRFVDTGQKARELLEIIGFDLFIMDDPMPHVDIWEMYPWIKSKAEFREMGIIITSARRITIDAIVVDNSFDKRDIAHFPKPYEFGPFLSSIEKVLRAYEKSHLIVPR